jgi:hypothetical protein
VPILPWLALGAAQWLRSCGRAQRIVAGAAIALAVAIAMTGAFCYKDVFSAPPTAKW